MVERFHQVHENDSSPVAQNISNLHASLQTNAEDATPDAGNIPDLPYIKRASLNRSPSVVSLTRRAGNNLVCA